MGVKLEIFSLMSCTLIHEEQTELWAELCLSGWFNTSAPRAQTPSPCVEGPSLFVLRQLWVGTPAGPGTSVAAEFLDVLQHLFTSPDRCQLISSCLHLRG